MLFLHQETIQLHHFTNLTVMKHFTFFLFFLSALATLAQPLVVAHRGYWRTDGSAQNSITSFQKAEEVGCWGSEFDVWLTADGIPVVFHDATINGMRIEDTTFAYRTASSSLPCNSIFKKPFAIPAFVSFLRSSPIAMPNVTS